MSVHGTTLQVCEHAIVDLSIDGTVYLAGIVVVIPVTMKLY